MKALIRNLKFFKYSKSSNIMLVCCIIMLVVGELQSFLFYLSEPSSIDSYLNFFDNGCYLLVLGSGILMTTGMSHMQFCKFYHSSPIKHKFEIKDLPVTVIASFLLLLINNLVVAGICSIFNPYAFSYIVGPLIITAFVYFQIFLMISVIYKVNVAFYFLFILLTSVMVSAGDIIGELEAAVLSIDPIYAVAAYIVFALLTAFITKLINMLLYRKEINKGWKNYNRMFTVK